MLAFALDKTTLTIQQLETTAPSVLRHYRQDHPGHVVVCVKHRKNLTHTLTLYGI